MATNVLDLYARVRFDSSEFNQGLSNAESSFSAFGDKISAGVGAIAKATAAAVAAGAAAVGKMVSDSVSAYSSYEQLVGGIQTLFGDSADKVIANSEKAYKTAGMSVNQYMETSIQSAAAMISSLEGDQATAAELMDMSIIDMSDNVNKMGTTMEAVQNAYRGFSRQNFTMLDNLALGFAGTKSGMQDLLDRAQQISGVEYNIESYSDIVKAIHVVQQEMGITGTTSKEAADTIQGSAGSMKAAWQNLKVELAKENGDIAGSIDIMVNSAMTAFENIGPKIKRSLSGMSEFISEIAPVLQKELPKIIKDMAPALLKSSASLVSAMFEGAVQSIPSLLDVGINIMAEINKGLRAESGGIDLSSIAEEIGKRLPTIFRFGKRILEALTDSLAENLPELIPEGVSAITNFIIGITDPKKLGVLTNAAFKIINGLIEGFTDPETLNAIIDGVPVIVENIVTGITDALPLLVDAAAAICEGLITYFASEEGREKMEEASDKMLTAFVDGIASLLEAGGSLCMKIGGIIADALGFGDYWQTGADAMKEWWEGFKDEFSDFKEWFSNEIKLTLNPLKLGKNIGEAVTKAVEESGGDHTARGGGSHRAAGGIFTKPTYDIYGNLYGEAGSEVLLPLDSNTSWMDKLAERISPNSGTIIQGDLVIQMEGSSISSDYDTDQFVERVSEKLANLHILQTRALGGTGYTNG